jgi:hypothetical protein
LSAEDRAALEADYAESPWPIRALIDSVAKDPGAFRARVFTVMPRVFLRYAAGLCRHRLAVLPAHAISRGARIRRAHLHAFTFLTGAISEAAKFTAFGRDRHTGWRDHAAVVSTYALRAQHAVFGGSRPETVAKATAIGLLYAIAAVPMFAVVFIWASMV